MESDFKKRVFYREWSEETSVKNMAFGQRTDETRNLEKAL